jgi:hypothetical protein
MTRAARAVGVALLVAQVGCATSYEPRRSPRIAAVHVNGRVFVRDGQRYEIGILGGNGEALVGGNEAATALMRKHRTKQIWGVSLLGLGIAAGITGQVMFQTADPHDRGPGVLVGALALFPVLAAAVVVASSRHDLANAVNLYNDALEGAIAPDAFEPPPPPPGGR